VIQHQQYDSKADVWALGCILYQIAMLHAPFEAKSLLALAKRIVEGNYAPVTGSYSPLVSEVVAACLSVDVDARPDIEGVSQLIAPLLVKEIDRLTNLTFDRSSELNAERSRRRLHQTEAEQHKLTIHSLMSHHLSASALDSSAGAATPSTPSQTQPFIPSLNGDTMPSARNPSSPPSRLSSDDRRPASAESSGSANDSGQRTPYPPGSSTSSRAHQDCGTPLVCERDAHQPVPWRRTSQSDAEVGSSALSSSSSSLGAPRGGQRPGSGKSRPGSGSGKTVRIGPRRVRSVDPITTMLNQLHKVIYVSQLPAVFAVHPNDQAMFERNRHFIDRYKRELFARHGRASSLKSELKLLSSGSADTLTVDLGSVPDKKEWAGLFGDGAGAGIADGDARGTEGGASFDRGADAPAQRTMTYARLQHLLEEVRVALWPPLLSSRSLASIQCCCLSCWVLHNSV
jgi:hypothetical protein